MPAVDAALVFLPRFTTLVGASTFATAPLDVSRQGGAQFQVWRGPIRVASGSGSLTLYVEESLDAQAGSWALGPSTPQGIPILENQNHFLSYSFRLRWFRLRLALAGTDPMVSCWAEGLLRGGDGGLWSAPDQRVASGDLGAGFTRTTGPTNAEKEAWLRELTAPRPLDFSYRFAATRREREAVSRSIALGLGPDVGKFISWRNPLQPGPTPQLPPPEGQ